MKVVVDGTVVGSSLWIDGARQRYSCIGEIELPGEDGEHSRLIILESRCPVCMCPFFICLPATGRYWFNRRCGLHAQPGRPVFPRPKKRRTA